MRAWRENTVAVGGNFSPMVGVVESMLLDTTIDRRRGRVSAAICQRAKILSPLPAQATHSPVQGP